MSLLGKCLRNVFLDLKNFEVRPTKILLSCFEMRPLLPPPPAAHIVPHVNKTGARSGWRSEFITGARTAVTQLLHSVTEIFDRKYKMLCSYCACAPQKANQSHIIHILGCDCMLV